MRYIASAQCIAIQQFKHGSDAMLSTLGISTKNISLAVDGIDQILKGHSSMIEILGQVRQWLRRCHLAATLAEG